MEILVAQKAITIVRQIMTKRRKSMNSKYHMSLEDNIFFAKRKLVDNVYRSAKLEGIAVTFAQTEDIFNNVNVANLRPDEIIAVLNLKNAWQFILDTIEEEITVTYIKRIHEEVASGIIRPAGEFRDRGVGISGTNWRPKLPSEVNYEEELEQIKQIKNPFEYALELFLWIQKSQMFIDGNKRTANLVANHELIKNGLGVISIPPELTGIYKQKLVDFYETNKTEEMKKFLYENCLDGVN